jgi:hypothetical protein
MAYRGDQKGFTQEIRIPWKLLFQKVPDLSEGTAFKMGMEFIWGGPDGRTKPVNRFADNVQAGEPTRQFFWSAQKIWGDATLVDEPPAQAAEKATNEGVPIRLDIPAGAEALTVVIENEAGATSPSTSWKPSAPGSRRKRSAANISRGRSARSLAGSMPQENSKP